MRAVDREGHFEEVMVGGGGSRTLGKRGRQGDACAKLRTHFRSDWLGR